MSDDRRWHGGRVLVAEDNDLLAEVVCDFLSDCNLQPIGPATGLEDAATLAQREILDGAVLDLRLGGHLCLPICEILTDRRIPFIFLTGYGDLSMISPEFRSAPIICKPFESAEMRSALAAMLQLDRGLRLSEPLSVLPN